MRVLCDTNQEEGDKLCSRFATMVLKAHTSKSIISTFYYCDYCFQAAISRKQESGKYIHIQSLEMGY